jgi:hypothetical protein
VYGGTGQLNFGANVYCGNGAPGITTTESAQLILAGAGQGHVWAGVGPANYYYIDVCCFDGDGAPAISNNGEIWYSAVTLLPSWDLGPNPCYCGSGFYPPIEGTQGTTQVDPPDPALSAVGTFSPHTTSTLTLHGLAGAHASLRVGRRVTVVADPSTQIETLVDGARMFDLGVIPASGTIDFPVYDPSWPPGTFLAAQATVTLPGGRIRRTNSVPMVFR